METTTSAQVHECTVPFLLFFANFAALASETCESEAMVKVPAEAKVQRPTNSRSRDQSPEKRREDIGTWRREALSVLARRFPAEAISQTESRDRFAPVRLAMTMPDPASHTTGNH